MSLTKNQFHEEINNPFEWEGEVENMNLHEYMKTTGDTYYEISGEIPKLLEIDLNI